MAAVPCTEGEREGSKYIYVVRILLGPVDGWLGGRLSPVECVRWSRFMGRTMSADTMAIVKSTAPALQQHGLAITKRMYERLFVDPEIKKLFDQAAQESGEQPRRLADAILAFAKNVDKLEMLEPAIERMASRHVATHVKPEHYPAVANALLPAIKDILGDAVDECVLKAWGEAYWFLADVLIEREKALYADQREAVQAGASPVTGHLSA
jgi:nitric oxide dioxygenase